MKNLYRYIAYVAVLAMLFTSCSKEETVIPMDDPSVQSVDLTFGAVLNDLSNRAMSTANKAPDFSSIPTCSGADPAVARIGFSYGGNSYETDVDILWDEDGYFTAYSEDLKIPVPNNDEVQVTLDSFMVYDGDPDGGGNLIWVAPKESDGNFDGYVDTALPFDFMVEDGTKPYIDVEVLCFDRRMVNEYGYVFFDILPEEIYPFCLFVNYCDEFGRHFVANYSVDLYFGTDDTGIQLYDNWSLDDVVDAGYGVYESGAYYSDPLCMVVPGPPANLPANEPYLYLVIHPNDWEGNYGDIDNLPTEGIPISWDMVSGYLNDDGETNEYHHVLIGECEGAIGSGDGGGNGGNGGSECDPSDPAADCDNDGVPNGQDNCLDETSTPENDLDRDGCIDEVTEPVACDLTIPDPDSSALCFRGVTPGDDTIDYANNGEFLLVESADNAEPIPLFEDAGTEYGPSGGLFTPSISGTSFSFTITPNEGYEITDYLVEIKDEANGDVSCVTTGTSVDGSFEYPIYIRVSTNICPTD
ncbi:hypothetical protein [Gramella sp. KN1008]|uniref:hypothetical protein n=1 Tax=Gramella sp. KN1008 TaxID=2529298 RepID=UPI00103DB4DF|nr:hypothetical protein [Gramella sp. KN1008]TBW26643.1 hypothetical protein EZJ28_13490 [Gramella sp. KN1008]